jgi:hypothetical protein
MEDVLGWPLENDPGEVVRAKQAIERAVANDAPALRALGLRERPADTHVALVHGSLTREKAHRTDRGVVIVEWAHAYLGDAMDDMRSIGVDPAVTKFRGNVLSSIAVLLHIAVGSRYGAWPQGAMWRCFAGSSRQREGGLSVPQKSPSRT